MVTAGTAFWSGGRVPSGTSGCGISGAATQLAHGDTLRFGDETLRALQHGAPLANDVIFLFADGDKSGALGARAFAAGNYRSEVGPFLTSGVPPTEARLPRTATLCRCAPCRKYQCWR